MNKPYIKEYDEKGILINLITKDNPYLHRNNSNRGKSMKEYIILRNHITGDYFGKLRAFGNNRANTCSSNRRNKGKHSRNYTN